MYKAYPRCIFMQRKNKKWQFNKKKKTLYQMTLTLNQQTEAGTRILMQYENNLLIEKQTKKF